LLRCVGTVQYILLTERLGWVGDVKNMLLDVSKIKGLGWKPRHNSADAVRLTVKEMLKGRDKRQGFADFGGWC